MATAGGELQPGPHIKKTQNEHIKHQNKINVNVQESH